MTSYKSIYFNFIIHSIIHLTIINYLTFSNYSMNKLLIITRVKRTDIQTQCLTYGFKSDIRKRYRNLISREIRVHSSTHSSENVSGYIFAFDKM